jgi:4-hydroxy-3-polyprenylbenzoate decarboxylase
VKTPRLIVGLSGASGARLGIRLLQVVRQAQLAESHLVISPAGRTIIAQETDWQPADVEKLADYVYNPQDIGAAIASGSFATAGMVIIPCSIKTLSAVAHCYAAGLMARAADVTLKEGRPLVLVVREAPLHAGHIRLMAHAARSGAIIFPPAPAFYARPQTVNDIIDGIVGRVLRRLGFENELYLKWGEHAPNSI